MDDEALKKEIEILRDVRFAARAVSDRMKKSSGGDAYEFTGSMNEVESLLEALSEYQDFRFEHGEAEDDDDSPD